MPDSLQISNVDRQQFISLFRDPQFLRESPDRQRQQLASLPVIQRVPASQRDKLIDGILQRKDQIRWRAAFWSPKGGTSLILRNPKTGAPERVETEPIAQPAFQSGFNQLRQGFGEIQQPGLPNKAQGASDIIRGGLGMASGALLPVGLIAAPAATLAGLAAGGIAQAGTEYGLRHAGVRQEYTNLAGDIAGLIGAGVGARGGEMSFGKLAREAKQYGVPTETYRAAQSMSHDQLTAATLESAQQADELRNLRRYNEQAGSAITNARQKINQLKEQRDAMELSLQDTSAIDQQIFQLESRLSAIYQKVAQNHNRIEALKGKNVEGHERMYADVLRSKQAVPAPRGSARNRSPVLVRRQEPQAEQTGLPRSSTPQAERPVVRAGEPVQANVPQKPTDQAPEPVRTHTPQEAVQTASAKPREEVAPIAQSEQVPPPPKPRPRKKPEATQTPQASASAQEVAAPPKPRVRKKAETTQAAQEVSPKPQEVASPKPQEITASPKSHARKKAEVVQTPQASPKPEEVAPPPKPRVRRESKTTQTAVASHNAQEVAAPQAPTEAASPKTQETVLSAENPAEEPNPEEKTAAPPKPRKSAAKQKPQEAPAPTAKESATESKPSEKPTERPTLQEGKLTEIPKEEIHVDPKRFQFKTKAIGRSGVTDKLADVTEVEPESLGTLTVWKDPKDGKTYVINGHHRLELAKRTGYEKPIPVRYTNAKTAEEARVVGALINIKEGQGEPIDVAKVMRDSGMDAQQLQDKFKISPRNPLLKQGQALAKLDDPVFRKVASGEITEGKGAIIGELLSNPADQEAAAKLAEKAERKRLTDAEFREAIRTQVARAPKTTKAEETLFGTQESEQNLVLERGEVSQYVRSQLASDRRLFGAVAKEKAASKLGETGNTIKVDQNAERAKQVQQALAVYDKLSGMSGKVSEALDQAAKEIGEGQNPEDVKRRTYDQIRTVLAEAVSELNGRGSESAREGTGGSEASRSVPPKTRRGVSRGEQREPVGLPKSLQEAPQDVQDAFLRLKEHLSSERGSLSNKPSNEPDILSDLKKLGKFYLDFGMKSFKEWSDALVSDLGERVKPHLESVWRSLGQKTLGQEEETERFNKEREADLNKQRAEAQLRGPIQQGDKGRVIEQASPLFRGQAIDTSAPQGNLFESTAAPPKSTEPEPKKPSVGWDYKRSIRERAQDLYDRYRQVAREADKALYENPDSKGHGVISPTIKGVYEGRRGPDLASLQRFENAYKEWYRVYGAKAEEAAKELIDFANFMKGKRPAFTDPHRAYEFLMKDNAEESDLNKQHTKAPPKPRRKSEPVRTHTPQEAVQTAQARTRQAVSTKTQEAELPAEKPTERTIYDRFSGMPGKVSEALDQAAKEIGELVMSSGTHVDPVKLFRNPVLKRAAEKLLSLGYPKDDEVLAFEASVWLLAEQYKELGLSREQALAGLRHYFDLLFEQHGEKAMPVLEGLKPNLRKDLYDEYRKKRAGPVQK